MELYFFMKLEDVILREMVHVMHYDKELFLEMAI